MLVQPEMERGRSPLVSMLPLERGFSRHWDIPIRWRFGGAAQEGSPRTLCKRRKACGNSNFTIEIHLNSTAIAALVRSNFARHGTGLTADLYCSICISESTKSDCCSFSDL